MKLNMMVVMTMWLPKRACSQAGRNAQAAPNERRARRSRAERPATTAGYVSKRERDERHAEAAEIGLPLAADVEQPGVEGDRDGEAGQDEVGGVEEREADALAVAERAAERRSCAARSGFSPMKSTTRPETRKAAATLRSGTRP